MGARTHSISGFAPQQQTFSFIPKKTRQLMAYMWEQHFDRAEARAKKQLETTRKRIELKVVGPQTDTFDWREHKDLLDLPLFRHVASEYDIQPALAVVEETKLTVITTEAAEQQVEWSDSDTALLHEKVLEYSLNVLNSKGNAEEKAEILRWIWVPDIYCWVTKDDDGVSKEFLINQGHMPFSFASCCYYYGINVELMHEGLAHVLRPVLKSLGMNSIIN